MIASSVLFHHLSFLFLTQKYSVWLFLQTLKSFKVKMLVLSAIPGLVETWTSHFGFKPIGDTERRQLNHVNLMLFPGTELLIKNLEDTTEETGEVIGDTKL